MIAICAPVDEETRICDVTDSYSVFARMICRGNDVVVDEQVDDSWIPEESKCHLLSDSNPTGIFEFDPPHLSKAKILLEADRRRHADLILCGSPALFYYASEHNLVDRAFVIRHETTFDDSGSKLDLGPFQRTYSTSIEAEWVVRYEEWSR